MGNEFLIDWPLTVGLFPFDNAVRLPLDVAETEVIGVRDVFIGLLFETVAFVFVDSTETFVELVFDGTGFWVAFNEDDDEADEDFILFSLALFRFIVGLVAGREEARFLVAVELVGWDKFFVVFVWLFLFKSIFVFETFFMEFVGGGVDGLGVSTVFLTLWQLIRLARSFGNGLPAALSSAAFIISWKDRGGGAGFFTLAGFTGFVLSFRTSGLVVSFFVASFFCGTAGLAVLSFTSVFFVSCSRFFRATATRKTHNISLFYSKRNHIEQVLTGKFLFFTTPLEYHLYCCIVYGFIFICFEF